MGERKVHGSIYLIHHCEKKYRLITGINYATKPLIIAFSLVLGLLGHDFDLC